MDLGLINQSIIYLEEKKYYDKEKNEIIETTGLIHLEFSHVSSYFNQPINNLPDSLKYLK